MPLNSFQRETLHNTVTACVDTILAQPLAYELKIHWLKEVISDVFPAMSQTIQILQQHIDLIQGLATAANVPMAVRQNWITLIGHIRNADQLPPAGLLQSLEIYNNYNPVLLASIQIFENSLTANTELGCVKVQLIRLREIYLEMTPLISYSYGTDHQPFYCRIGHVPLNLDQGGPIPDKGEVQTDIVRIIKDRITQAEKHQKELQEKEHEKKLAAEARATADLREQDFAFAVNLHLSEVEEQRRCEQFKRRIASSIEVTPTEHIPAIHFADLLFPTTQIVIESYTLYLLSSAKLTTFETANITKAIVLSFDPQGSSNSAGLRHYNASFIEDGQWLKEGRTLILKLDMGDLGLPTFQEGILEQNSDLLKIMQTAIFKRDQFTKQQVESSTVKRDFLFFQMHGALNSRFTAAIDRMKEKIIALDTTLKQTPNYLELRKTEFSKILLQVQQSAVTTCFTAHVDWDTVNQTYQEQLAATYHMYIQDICTNWMANRSPHLSEAAIEVAAGQFKTKIDRIMDKDFQKYKNLVIGPSNIKKLSMQLPKNIEALSLKILTLKSQWDNAVLPLSNLADECNILRKLRTQMQTEKVIDWYTLLDGLQRVAQFFFNDAPNMPDLDGFTLLHYACWCGHIELVKTLIAQKNNIWITSSREGYSALHFAVQNTSNTVIPLLELLLKESSVDIIRFPSKIKKIPLHIAASRGNLSTITWLLQKAPDTLRVEDSDATTPLHEAARNGHSQVVQYLLRLGANPHALNVRKKSPILLAALEGQLKTMQVFFEAGFCLNTEETAVCLSMIEKQHPDSKMIIDCIAVALTHTAHTFSQLNLRLNRAAERQTPRLSEEKHASYLPAYQSQAESALLIPPESSPVIVDSAFPEVAEYDFEDEYKHARPES